MKNSILGQVVKAQIDLSPDLVKLTVAVVGTKLSWAVDCTPEESKHLRFMVNKASGGVLEPEGAEDLFSELALFSDAVKRQLTEIESLRESNAQKSLTISEAEKNIADLKIALANQKEVIDDLRGRLGEAISQPSEKTIPVEAQAEFHNETLPNLTQDIPSIPNLE